MAHPQTAGKLSDSNTGEGKTAYAVSSAPALSLPKGGGAIRGIGEKFAANPVTGTGAVSVPIATSPGRSGFGPRLNLTYDAGLGNGPFGFGWSLGLPSVTRKTDKGLPRYDDASESDVFLLSNAEDLVPVYRQDAAGNFVKDGQGNFVVHEDERGGHRIRRYRPRVEGLFARIERWTAIDDSADVHWRSISKDNVLTLYGRDSDSRIADPLDSTRIFSWLICETRDDKGNGISYVYEPEDGKGVDLLCAHQRNRGPRDDRRRAANRYLKRILYGNRTPLLDAAGRRPPLLSPAQVQTANWMFEVIFDYGEHDQSSPMPGDDGEWHYRNDPFSTYRAGFEVRTSRLCRRVLMFHHFPAAPGVGLDCLVRSTDFAYSDEAAPQSTSNPIYSFLVQVTQTSYRRANNGYERRSLPPVSFSYSLPQVQDIVEELDAKGLENLPIGVDGTFYQWVDLHGEGIQGILAEQADGWYYKRNLSPLPEDGAPTGSPSRARLAPIEKVAVMPNVRLGSGQAQFSDLAGDGLPDIVVFDGSLPGLYEHDAGEGWQPFRPFESRLNRNLRDPNLKLVDLDGNGLADVLIAEGNGLLWHPSLGEDGFGPALRVAQPIDEEMGPHLVFADGEQAIYLADMSGDGLADLVRVRNGEVCYWPNLGYGRFGAKVAMDDAPCFDSFGQFDQRRVRLADIDGSGTTDLVYLHGEGVRLYFNQSGNSWSKAVVLPAFGRVDDLTSVAAVDLLGNGTACLLWSSPLAADGGRQMRYVKLMGDQKPHLMVKMVNNLGAETRVQYAPAIKFYLQDRRDGRPWITRLPFPVHVVERVETYDYISRNRFVTTYTYHHGYFDGEEREFRGFGLVEQQDAETMTALTSAGLFGAGANDVVENSVPPVLTKTWYHTGAYFGRDQVSQYFASKPQGLRGSGYYREPLHDDGQAAALLLPDTVLPGGLSAAEEREACRALKGSMLRQEVYALDGSDRQIHPYVVTEQTFTLRLLQGRGLNRHAVFFAHPREALTLHYDRKLYPVLDGKIVDEAAAAANPATRRLGDPRVQHALTLEVDDFGNVLASAAIGYGRRYDAPDSALLPADRVKQRLVHITCTENRYTAPKTDEAFEYRTPLPAESCTYELRKTQQDQSASAQTQLYSFESIGSFVRQARGAVYQVDYTDANFAAAQATVLADAQKTSHYFRRLIEKERTLYRPDDLGAAQNDASVLLPLGQMGMSAIGGESYKLAFTSALLGKVFVRSGQTLLPNPAAVLGGGGSGQGGYVDLDGDGRWWIPGGRVFFSPDGAHSAGQELAQAQSHFFLPQRYRNAFATAAFRTDVVVRYDQHDLLVVETRDPLDNVTTAITADDDGNWALRVDYRVLQPFWITDPNGNRARVAFDVLGMVAGTAVMGKPQPAELEGDTLAGFDDELDAAQIDAFFDAADPRVPAAGLLNGATTRIIYDFDRFWHSQRAHPEDPELWQPIYTATVVRETHVRNLNGGQSKVQVNFSYSDGFGREIQKKVQAEKGPIVKGGPPVDPRWVGSGWTVYNNKGKPVRQYEPFFSTLPQRRHHFEFGVMQGVSPILFYDPVGRVIATLHPNRTYEKVVFNPWQQTTWDANDTVAPGGKQTGDPRTDPDIGGYVRPYFKVQAGDWQTWYTENSVKALGDPLRAAADKAAAHSNTPASAYLDTLGRVFLTITHNKVKCPGHALDGEEEHSCTRVELDIEGNQRSVRDAIVQSEDVAGRVVALYDYDLLGNPVRHASMEAGVRWNLNDVMGQPLWTWDGRGHTVCTEYDSLRRPIRRIVTGVDLAQPGFVRMVERMVYGEQHPGAQSLNLRGKLFLHLDQAGVLANEAYDFKNNLLQAARRLATDYRQTPSWTAVDAILPADVALQLNVDEVEAAIAALVEPHSYPSSTVYDALNRPVLLTLPSADGAPASSVRPHYNDANLLERVDANLQGAQANGQPLWTQFVNDIAYDAKGQRVFIAYANGVTTTYEYDTDTYRLTEMLTKRQPGAFPSDCSDPQPAGWAGCEVQNLHYVYDPAGNLTHVRDTAQQTIYFRNRRVEPSAEYTYDALYRLVEATGREHLGQSGSPVPSSWNDEGKTAFLSADGAGRFAPSDGNAMGAYVERYVYDAVGNFTAMQHRGSDPTNLGWTRTYVYGETSLLEDGQNGALLKWSNRLTSTSVSGNDGAAERYRYDERGNMLRLPHLGGSFPGQNLSWDYRDQLQSADMGGGGTVFYTCDAGGQRVRKVWEKTAGRVEERIYLGAIEIFRRRSGNQLLERETLHIMDDQRRVALVETRIVDDAHADPASAQLLRYQFSNHLGTATLELDEQAQIISYEEYSPYGSTVHQAVNSTTETPKRYRYTGKERDEESGLYYFGARYYAPWLGRWTACDKDTRSKDRNRYLYVRCNPLKYTDPNGMYEEPVHGATTYRLALAAGFKRDDAAKIALSTAGMDHDPGTRPGDGVLEMIKQIFLGRTKKYHFASQDKALKDVKSDIAKGTKMDLTQLGRHMHTLEDVGFKDAPGPHMRAQERLLPTLTGHIGRGLLFGGAVSLMIGGPVGVGLGIGLLLLGGLFSIFSLFAQGIGHPTYKTEKGDLSHSFSHKADEAYQDPERNAKVLTRVYSELKEAASAYYGKQVASNDAAADKAIEGVTAADTESKLRAYMDEGLDEHGNPTAEPSGKSYSQIVTEHSKRAGSEFPSPWSACDASIDDKPVLNLCVPR